MRFLSGEAYGLCAVGLPQFKAAGLAGVFDLTDLTDLTAPTCDRVSPKMNKRASR